MSTARLIERMPATASRLRISRGVATVGSIPRTSRALNRSQPTGSSTVTAYGGASWAGTWARPARRRSSWAGTWARPARRRSSWAGTWARPARRRSSWAGTWARPAKRRSSWAGTWARPVRRRLSVMAHRSGSGEVDVVVVERLAVDALPGRRDPGRDLAALVHGPHQRPHVGLVDVGGQPGALAPRPLLGGDALAVRCGLDAGERADLTVESDVRQPQPLRQAGALHDLVPPVDTVLTVADVLAAQVGVEAQQGGGLRLADPAVIGDRVDHDGLVGQPVVVAAPLLRPPSLQARGEVVGDVGGGLRPEQVQGHRVVEVQVLLDDVQRDAAVRAHVVGVVLQHQLHRALHHPVDAGRTDEHVVRLFLEHELTGARQRVERRLLERAELVLAVPVGEVGEHEERQPVRSLLVERAQDARRLSAAAVAVQQFLGLLAPVPAEVGVQQVHHRPQMPALLHVDLEEVAQVIQAGCDGAQIPLLFHRRGFGVALDDDQALQVRPVLPRYLLPHRFVLVMSEGDAPTAVA